MSRNGRVVGEIEWCDFQWETRNLAEKLVEATEVASEVEGGEVDEPSEEAREERACWTPYIEWKSKIVGDGEKLLRDDGERLEVATTVVVFVTVDKEFEDKFPTLIR